MNEEKKPFMAIAIITLIAVGGLVVLFDYGLANNEVTGALSGQQTAYSRLYGLKYHYNPCGMLTCSSGEGIPVSTDPATGDIWCRCPNHKVPYFRVSHWTKR
jgi:hypothetical protein